jgi:predicted RNA binding protein YcfA (HicA-like mRNA interferase family)
MGKIPVLSPLEVVKLLEQHGFTEIRQKGSHKQYKHSDGRQTTIPFHKGRDLSPILLRQIVKDINMTIEEFLKVK